MVDELKFDYYYGVQSEQFSFYRIPRLLIKDQHFKCLSSDAKLLYGLMLDRMALSMKNHWLDDENRAYIIYSIDSVMDDLGCSKPTCVKIMKELDTFGLIERRRKGLGKPDIIYVKNFVLKEECEESENEAVEEGDGTEITEEGLEYPEEEPSFQPDDLTAIEAKNITARRKESELLEVKDMTSSGKEIELPEVKKINFWESEKVTSSDEDKEKKGEKGPNLAANDEKKGEIDFRSKKIELPEVKKFNFWNSKNLTSGGKEVLPLEVKNFAPNYNNNNYNNQSYNSINPSNLSNQRDQSCKDEMDKSDAYIQQIKKNLDYDCYMTNDVAYMDKDLLKELFDLICDVVCAKSEIIKISGDVYSRDYVRSKFLRLTSEHVMYVMDCIKNTTTKIANIKAYLLVALFNAPSTISHYYQQEVKHYTDSDIQGVG